MNNIAIVPKVKTVRSKGVSYVESNTKYYGCTFDCILVNQVRGVLFDNCSFRENVTFGDCKDMEFANTNFSGSCSVHLEGLYESDIPEWVYSLPVESLSFYFDEAKNQTPNLGPLHKLPLKRLSLVGMHLENFSFVEKPMQALEKLNMSSNQISHIDSSFAGLMPNLRELDISFNYIRQIHSPHPKWLIGLKHLDISYNPVEDNFPSALVHELSPDITVRKRWFEEDDPREMKVSKLIHTPLGNKKL